MKRGPAVPGQVPSPGFSPLTRNFVPGETETGLEPPPGREERGCPGPTPPPASAGPGRAEPRRCGAAAGAERRVPRRRRGLFPSLARPGRWESSQPHRFVLRVPSPQVGRGLGGWGAGGRQRWMGSPRLRRSCGARRAGSGAGRLRRRVPQLPELLFCLGALRSGVLYYPCPPSPRGAGCGGCSLRDPHNSEAVGVAGGQTCRRPEPPSPRQGTGGGGQEKFGVAVWGRNAAPVRWPGGARSAALSSKWGRTCAGVLQLSRKRRPEHSKEAVGACWHFAMEKGRLAGVRDGKAAALVSLC